MVLADAHKTCEANSGGVRTQDAGRLALPPGEFAISIVLLVSVLGLLGAAKSLAPLAYVGPLALTMAAFWQLRAPLWRVERLGMGFEALGCHWGAWRRDAATTAVLAVIFLPLYAAGYHLLMTQGAALADRLYAGLGARLAVGHLVWRLPPQDAASLMRAGLWFAERALTHIFGVALVEELFYRGYLQPLWQARWPRTRRILGAEMGPATLAVSVCFALGHIVGEWRLERLGPFFPSLLFAWQRARSGTIVGAVGLHALCNLFAEVWVRQYAPGAPGAI